MRQLLWGLFAWILFLGAMYCFLVIRTNALLEADIASMEKQVGRQRVLDLDKVHITEFDLSEQLPEVAEQVGRVIAFRIYLPANYPFATFGKTGEILADGISRQGVYSSSNPSRNVTEPVNAVLILSFRQNGNHVEIYDSFRVGGQGMSSTSVQVSIKNFDSLVLEKLTKEVGQTVSFSKDMILPIVKYYDPQSAKSQTANGKEVICLEGGISGLYPLSLNTELEQLAKGALPSDFQPPIIAVGEAHE